MDITSREEQGVLVVSTSGDIDSETSPQLWEEFERLLEAGRRHFVIDLAGTGFIDSSGLSTLVRLFKHARASTGEVTVVGLRPNVQRVFTLTRLDRVFDIYPEPTEAIQRLASRTSIC